MLNRASLFAQIERHIKGCARNGAVLGVMLVRIRRLRQINAIFGYEAGDRLMAAVHALIERVLRPADEVIRVGDTQFAVLLPGVRNANHALLAANRVILAFEEPVITGERQILVATAVGVSVYPDHGDTAEELYRGADLALTDALRSSDRVAVYSAFGAPLQVEYGELYETILNNRLELYLQPIWDMRRRTTVGVEALSRWCHPSAGWVSPALFIPFAEQTGLIAQLTRWSLNTALRHCAHAREEGIRLPVSVNLSPLVFAERDIVEQIMDVLRIWDIPAGMLVAEVTETALTEDPLPIARVLERLCAAGIRIAIDDFGTGYSSFTYLQRFPASLLKIDKTFVADLFDDDKNAQLVRSMIDLGHNLGMAVIAEGVENQATLECLAGMGCDFAQGYHLARPAPAGDVVDALTRGAQRVS